MAADLSQHGEYSKVIKPFFDGMDPKKLTVVDIGANQYMRSNSANLLLDGWQGFLYEPQVEVLAKYWTWLVENKAAERVHLKPFALGTKTEYGTLYRHREHGHASLLPDWRKDTLDKDGKTTEILIVDAAKELQRISRGDARAIDFLDIDVEGMENDLLAHILAGGSKPRLILVEDTGISADTLKLLEKCKYREHNRIENNIFYALMADPIQ